MERSGPVWLLAGDIGGTSTRLSLFRPSEKSCHLIREETFPSRDYPGLKTILLKFLEGQKIAAACFGVAGPVLSGRVRLTNLPWVVLKKSLQSLLSNEKVEIINDVVAHAYGIRMLQKSDFAILNRGVVEKGNMAIISAGTGLGKAIFFWDGNRHLISPSEGGHVDFAPRNRLEMELLQSLFSRYGHVSYERIVSGEGIHTIYRFLRDSHLWGKEPAWLAKRMKKESPAAVISQVAREKRNRLCMKTLDVFASVYGAAAGNLVLQVMGVGGVYVGGGIAPKVVWKLKEGGFMDAFRNKGRYSGMMARIPVKVILNERTGLLGAASVARNLLD